METPLSTYNFGRLFNRIWTVLTKEPRGKGRLSRGEYVLTSMLIGLIVALITTPLSWVSMEATLIISLIGQIIAFFLMIRRGHDLNKPWTYVGIPTIGIVLVTLIALYLASNGQLAITNLMTGQGFTPAMLILGVLAIIFLIWSLIVGLMLLFKKGTIGTNNYGEDPLNHQPTSSGLYRGLGIVFLIAMLILAQFEKQEPMNEFDMNQYLPTQELNDTLIPTEGETLLPDSNGFPSDQAPVTDPVVE